MYINVHFVPISLSAGGVNARPGLLLLLLFPGGGGEIFICVLITSGWCKLFVGIVHRPGKSVRVLNKFTAILKEISFLI